MSLLSTYLVKPREEHLNAVVHVMAYVGQIFHSRLVYDGSDPEIDHNVFNNVIGQSSVGMSRRL